MANRHQRLKRAALKKAQIEADCLARAQSAVVKAAVKASMRLPKGCQLFDTGKVTISIRGEKPIIGMRRDPDTYSTGPSSVILCKEKAGRTGKAHKGSGMPEALWNDDLRRKTARITHNTDGLTVPCVYTQPDLSEPRHGKGTVWVKRRKPGQ